MAGGIEIPFTSNTRALLRGTKDVQEGLEDVQDSLDDLATAAHKDSVGDAMKGEAKAVDRETEKMEKSFKELSDTQKRETKGLGDDIGRNVKKGTDEGKEGLGEFRDEANSTARESAASFDGSAESIADSFQEVAANAFAGFGPAGAAAGLAVALGLGMAITAGQGAADAINEAKERTGELALELLDAGGDIEKVDLAGKMRDWGVAIADNREFWELWQDSAVSNMDKARKSAKLVGVDFETMFRGMSGYDADDAERALTAVNREIEDLEDRIRSARGAGDVFAGVQDEDGQRLDALRGVRKELGNVRDETKDATAASEALAQVTREETAAQEASEAALAARTAALDGYQSGVDAAVGAFGDFQNAESGALDPAGYIQGIRDRISATSEFSGNINRLASDFGLSQAGVQALIDQGIDFAPMLQSIINSGLAPEYVAQIEAALGAGQSAVDGTPLNSTVNVDADTSAAERDVKGVETKPRKTDVDVKAKTSGAERDVNALTSKPRKIEVDVRADTGRARRAIDALGASREATITAVASTYAASRALDAVANRSRTATIRANVVDRNGRQVN
jgi:hypothetical protein